MQEKTNQQALWIAIFGALVVSFLGHLFIDFSNQPTAFLGLPDWMLYYMATNLLFIIIFYQFVKRYYISEKS